MEDIIDERPDGPKEVPQAVKTLGIISIIGSSLWALIFLIAMFYVIAAGSMIRSMIPVADPTGAIVMVVLIVLIFVLIHVFKIVGVARYMKGKKGGYTLYAILNGLWTVLILLSGINAMSSYSAAADYGMFYIVCGLISAGLIAGLGMQLKNMPK